MKEKTKEKTEVPAWLHIPEGITYYNLITQLHQWLATTGRNEVFLLAAQKLEEPQLGFQTNWLFNSTDNPPTQVNTTESMGGICVDEIESIIKLLNKHKALLEASKGIE